jgi:hypothetical protein
MRRTKVNRLVAIESRFTRGIPVWKEGWAEFFARELPIFSTPKVLQPQVPVPFDTHAQREPCLQLKVQMD